MITIYILTYCGYSLNAIELLKENNLEYQKIECDNIRDETDNIYPGYNTYPKIFFNNYFLGGYSQLNNILLLKNKKINNKNYKIKKLDFLEIKQVLEILYYVISKIK